jgi:hypothetical protein
MRHPLENPSLTPLGFGSGDTPTRTRYKKWEGNLNGDWFAAKVWDKANRLKVMSPRPAEVIIHEIMPGMKTLGRTAEADIWFDGKPYLTADLAIISTFARWLGTNWGSDFLSHIPYNMPPVHPSKEFLTKLDLQAVKTRPMVEHFKHTCSMESCGKGRDCLGAHITATEREHLAVKAFAFWLGTSAGRVYIADYQTKHDQTQKRCLGGIQERTRCLSL